MPIFSRRGNIMEVAPESVEAIALWIYSGFNGRYSIWKFELPDRNPQLLSVIGADNLPIVNGEFDIDSYVDNSSPWQSRYDSLWSLKNDKYEILKYVYVFANPHNAHSFEGDINVLINRCLNELARNNIRSVGMIFIPNADIVGTDTDELAAASRMVTALQNWLNNNNDRMKIELVDRVDDFARVM